MKSITIIGLGWLGEGLAKELTLQGYVVKGTKTSKRYDGRDNLFQWSLGENFPSNANSSIYIICISSKLIDVNKYEKLYKELISLGAKKIIFISTTSVYNGLENEVTEDEKLIANQQNEKHLKVSNLLSDLFENSIILRLSGLVGPNRNPAKFLAARKNVLNPSQKINLVHQYDVIKFIEQCIKRDVRGIFNVCSSAHPSRKLFYTKVCKGMNLEPPEFLDDTENIRWISNEKSKKELDFKYKYDDLLEYYLSSDSKE